MEGLVKGDVIVLPFPYSDLTATKKRPALVIAVLQEKDVILCQITSQEWNEPYSIPLLSKDFKQGQLNSPSYIKSGKLFTADKRIVLYKIGFLKENKIKETEKTIVKIICK